MVLGIETCGELHRTLMEQLKYAACLQPAAIPDKTTTEYSSYDSERVAYANRAIGFMAGQAEKVYNRACPAFMIRPGLLWFDWAKEAMSLVCHHYGLACLVYYDAGELWGVKEPYETEAIQMLYERIEPNSPAWHWTRARLCGIPNNDVDHHYHQRAGHGLPCEPRREVPHDTH